jgi:oxidoreductase
VSDGVCLVTGATGFIGGHVVSRLVRDGGSVRCLVRRSSDTSLLRELGVEIVVGDLTSARSLAAAVAGCRWVVHCGALVSDWATRSEISDVNVGGTHNVVDAAVSASVQRLVHVSTTDVYGHPGGAAVDETYAATRFRNWYAETKLAAEAEVRRAERTQGLDAVILRPATVYGPRSTDVVGEIARAIRGGHMVLIDRGRAIAGLCYVDNLVDLAMLALRHDAARGQAFNATDGLDVTWRRFTDDLAEGLDRPRVRWSLPYGLANAVGLALESGYRLLRRTTGLTTAPLLSRQAVGVMGLDQDFSNAKARALLGWEPRVDYAAGIEATLGWLREV